MEDPMNAALLSQTIHRKEKENKGNLPTRTEDTENPATRGMADVSREDVPGDTYGGGRREERGGEEGTVWRMDRR